jgi:uncharacterized protein
MKKQNIQWAVNLGKTLEHILVTTSDSRGLPHVAAAGKIAPVKDEKVAVSEWFCPTTLENLQNNRLISLVIWDPVSDKGYQLLGEVEGMENEAMMNGYAFEPGIKEPMAQVKWKLMVRVDKVIDFTQAPHNDIEE